MTVTAQTSNLDQVEVEVDSDTAALSFHDFPDHDALDAEVRDAQQALDDVDLKTARNEFTSKDAQRQARKKARERKVAADIERDQADRLTQRITEARRVVDQAQAAIEQADRAAKLAEKTGELQWALSKRRERIEQAMSIEADVGALLHQVQALALQAGYNYPDGEAALSITSMVPFHADTVRREFTLPPLYGPERMVGRLYVDLMEDHGVHYPVPPRDYALEARQKRDQEIGPKAGLREQIGREPTDAEVKRTFSNPFSKVVAEILASDQADQQPSADLGDSRPVGTARRRPKGSIPPAQANTGKEATAA